MAHLQLDFFSQVRCLTKKVLFTDISDDTEIDSNGSSPVLKRRRKEENFDPCEFLRESVTEPEIQDISMSSLAATTEEDYEFATHVVKVKRTGQIIDVSSLWEMEGMST